jgi:hypothetical protein
MVRSDYGSVGPTQAFDHKEEGNVAKKARRRRARKKNKANHGKRPNA